MGSLIPIGGGADAEIKASLNFAFNETNIQIVRSVFRNESLFDGTKHHLHRVAWRLGAYPVQHYSGDNANGKWFYFLKQLLPGASYGGVSTVLSINKILTYAMTNATVLRVVFDAVQGTDNKALHYVYPGNPTKDKDISNLVNSTGTLLITLICPAPLDDNNTDPTPNTPGDADQGETQPPQIFTRSAPAAAFAPPAPVAPVAPAAAFTPSAPVAPAAAVKPKAKKAKKAAKKAAKKQSKKKAKAK